MKEADVQTAVAKYIRLRYPNVIFHSDFGSGIKLTKGQAIKQKRQNGGLRGYPDMFIAEPRSKTVAVKKEPVLYHGLFLEFKKAKTRLKKKDGSWASDHIKEQAEMMDRLREKGYFCSFGVGFDEAVDIIDEYLKEV